MFYDFAVIDKIFRVSKLFLLCTTFYLMLLKLKKLYSKVHIKKHIIYFQTIVLFCTSATPLYPEDLYSASASYLVFNWEYLKQFSIDAIKYFALLLLSYGVTITCSINYGKPYIVDTLSVNTEPM